MADYKSTSIDGIDDIQDQAGNERLETILETEVDTSTGAVSYDITGIPNGIKQIVIMFVGVSTSGSSHYMIQLGDAGGMELTGYFSAASSDGGSSTNETDGLALNAVPTSGSLHHGSMTLTLENSINFTWANTSMLARSDVAVNYMGAGSKSLSAVLTQLRITTTGGSNTFDAGVLNIQMRF